jgi:radical SAM protein with 4Fe4S-binding SPASM domain
MIAYTKRKGLRIHLVTNGTCLDVPRGEAILRSGLDSGDRVIFSVLGFSKEVHEAIMRGVDHHKVMANIHGFVALRKKFGLNGPVIETVFLNMPENLAERRPFLAYWRPVVDHVRSEGAISRQFAEFNSGQKPPLPVRKRTCAYLWDRLLVFWNGDAAICIADLDGTHRLGNLQQQSIREIWSCDNLMAIRQMHRERRFQELPLCGNCDW